MTYKRIGVAGVLLAAIALGQGCTDPSSQPGGTASPATASTNSANEPGTLLFRANGEDFVRKGFTSKDGWAITFDRLYVNLADVTAYQTNPPYNAEAGGDISSEQKVSLEPAKTVDLAAGDGKAEPILVSQVQAPTGQYNALSWTMPKATEGEAQGYSLVMLGQAKKNGKTVDFTLKLDRELAFRCGEFVGDTRKGILQPGETAEMEATFHFDHLFGDAETPLTDALNKGALGFEPLAAIATNGKLDTQFSTLKQKLSPQNYDKLVKILPSLGHVGEGHCQETTLAQQNTP